MGIGLVPSPVNGVPDYYYTTPLPVYDDDGYADDRDDDYYDAADYAAARDLCDAEYYYAAGFTEAISLVHLISTARGARCP